DARREQRREPHPQHRPGEHADERQKRHGHAVAPSRYGCDQREQDDDEIDPAHVVPAPELTIPRPPADRPVQPTTLRRGPSPEWCPTDAPIRPDPTARTIGPP